MKKIAKTNKPTAKKEPSKTKPATPTRDALNGRLGSRMSAVNLFLISQGKHGATVEEAAEATGERADTISAQFSDHIRLKRPVTRKVEKSDGGRKIFRYFATNAKAK